MAKLVDLIPKKNSVDFIEIQGIKIPIKFTFTTLDFISDVYGKSFDKLLSDLNDLDKNGKGVVMDTKTLRVMKAIIYGVVRTGGTETTSKELMDAIPFSDITSIAEKCMALVNKSYFQSEDTEKIKEDKSEKK